MARVDLGIVIVAAARGTGGWVPAESAPLALAPFSVRLCILLLAPALTLLCDDVVGLCHGVHGSPSIDGVPPVVRVNEYVESSPVDHP
eukprot:3431280-Prymnesium_polylepis.1